MTKTRVFSKSIDGEVQTMLAYSAADVVQYTYDGWRDITDEVAEAQRVAKEFPAGDKQAAGDKR